MFMSLGSVIRITVVVGEGMETQCGDEHGIELRLFVWYVLCVGGRRALRHDGPPN